MTKKAGAESTLDADFIPFPLPAFDLPGDDGHNWTPDSLKGRWTVLFLYPADNTPTCTQEAIDFSTALPQFEAAGARVIGLSKDDLKSHGKFKTKHALTPVLLSDTTPGLIDGLGAWIEKSMYGRTYMGTDRSTFLIDPHGVVQAAWRKVRIKGHVQAVLDTLKVKSADIV
ncbi:peroxiredoxin [Asticcacaulis sp. AND118]|uniref:peroxiredoxin n=1 Tax=Asticcacaulis sp. AND118 TaxID=2840468 RepID=UPI001CFF5D7C|nr:peroxiredoxin [Asticcacaulis sp. AND118]UDF02242.1 peroxiredoxin [Asticcacaulis sp. AND118]